MSEQQPRKKWSERQYELFLETASELGPNVSREAFDRILDRLVSARPAKPGSGGANGRKSC
jgi:hypothetical protein